MKETGTTLYTYHYFSSNFLLFIDESHVAIPQIHGMLAVPVSKKALLTLAFVFLLFDNRPLSFENSRQRWDTLFMFQQRQEHEYQAIKLLNS